MKRLLCLALPIALAACTKTPEPAPLSAPEPAATAATQPAGAAGQTPATTAATLGGHHWKLQDAKNAQGQRIEALFVRPDQPVTLDFADQRIGISNTCNRMGGSYAEEGDSLRMGRFSSTMMACADSKLMALDQEVGKRLEGTVRYALLGFDTPTLTLTTATGDVLTFAGEPTADTRYGGPGERVFLEVAAQTKPCSHPLIPDKQCLQVREIRYDDAGIKQGASEWQNFYEDIEGYTHEAGVRNVLRVNRYKRDPVPADASANAYVLDMVVESETVER